MPVCEDDLLDLSTLYVMVSLLSVVAGIVHLVPWATGRFGRWAAWWGSGHLLLGLTAGGVLLHDAGAPDAIIGLINPLEVFAYAAIFAGVRSFDRPDDSFRPVLLAAVVVAVPLLFWTDHATVGMRVAYLSVVRALFDAATVLIAIRVARRESLHTGWITATMFAVTVPLFLGRAWTAGHGQIGPVVTGPHGGAAAWLAATLIAFIMFRGFALFTMEAERAQRRLTTLLERDPLTGAGNRACFERRCGGWSGQGAALMIDVDLFKQLNDRCGHAAGDAALRIVARTAAEVLGDDGCVFRWGGDEFVCILPGADADAADAAAAAIVARFARGIGAVAPADLPVTLSIGRAHGSLADGVALLARADAAMYAIKAQRPHGRANANAALPIRTRQAT